MVGILIIAWLNQLISFSINNPFKFIEAYRGDLQFEGEIQKGPGGDR
jgi:hypothetical protein